MTETPEQIPRSPRTETVSGTVVAVSTDRATVSVESSVSCARCAAGRGCGAAMFQGDKTTTINVPVPPGVRLQAGDPVTLAIGSASVLRAALIAYALPLLTTLAGLLLVQTFLAAPDDRVAVIAAIIGMLGGLLLGRRLLAGQRHCDQFVPQIAALGHVNER